MRKTRKWLLKHVSNNSLFWHWERGEFFPKKNSNMLWWYFLKDGGYLHFWYKTLSFFFIKTRTSHTTMTEMWLKKAHINSFLSSGSTRPPHFSLKYFVRHLILGSNWALKKRIGALISRYIHMTWKKRTRESYEYDHFTLWKFNHFSVTKILVRFYVNSNIVKKYPLKSLKFI